LNNLDTTKDYLTLISLDQDYHGKLLPEEIVALLLHEIGHVLDNESTYPTYLDGEYIADAFANSKGFGKFIISGLEKGLKNNWYGFSEGDCKLRISAIRNNPVKTYGEDEL
jgi:hypothetical protein